MSFTLCFNIVAAYAIPSFVIETKNCRAREGEKGKFKCKFTGNPPPGKRFFPLAFALFD